MRFFCPWTHTNTHTQIQTQTHPVEGNGHFFPHTVSSIIRLSLTHTHTHTHTHNPNSICLTSLKNKQKKKKNNKTGPSGSKPIHIRLQTWKCFCCLSYCHTPFKVSSTTSTTRSICCTCLYKRHPSNKKISRTEVNQLMSSFAKRE